MRIRELTIQYAPREGTTGGRQQIKTMADAAWLVRPIMFESVEVFELILLDAKHRLIAVHRSARGTLDSCMVHPRDVLKAVLLANAAAFVTAHNHPSGDSSPSPDDKALFTRLHRACEVVGVTLLDNLVIGRTSYWSESTGVAHEFATGGDL